jgi:tripartite-type tricarboxylate transporter receptor subunit TctC
VLGAGRHAEGDRRAGQCDLNKALATQALKDSLRAQGADAAGGSSAEFATIIRKDFAKWAKVVKDSGARVDYI